MQTYYSFTSFFNNVATSHPNVETFTLGDLYNVDMAKQTLFPLAHLIVNNTTIASGVMTYNVTFMVMDRVVDVVPDSSGPFNNLTSDYKDVTNIIDVHNTSLLTINDIVSYIYRNPGALDYNVIGDSIATPFEERFDNLLAGWAIDLNISVGNPQDMCVIDLDVNLAEGGEPAC